MKAEYNTVEWNVRRLMILERDNNTCVNCGSRQSLHVHHIKYANDKRKCWEYDDEWLETLCKVCHEKEHRIAIYSFYLTYKIRKWKFGKRQFKELLRKYNINYTQPKIIKPIDTTKDITTYRPWKLNRINRRNINTD